MATRDLVSCVPDPSFSCIPIGVWHVRLIEIMLGVRDKVYDKRKVVFKIDLYVARFTQAIRYSVCTGAAGL